MTPKYPAGTSTIRNLAPRFNYFLVVKPETLVKDVPQIEYFVYRYKSSVSSKDGISALKKYFTGITLTTCKELSDTEYATGIFLHPHYLNNKREPLNFKLKEIPIYNQSQIRVIDLTKDLYQYGSVPIIKDSTASILEYSQPQRVKGKLI